MKRYGSQDGFTLLEVMIVLAISSLALSLFLAGQGLRRQQTQFTVDINTLVNQMKEQQNDSQSGVSFVGNSPLGLPGQNPTGSSNFTYYGRQLEVWPAGLFGNPGELVTWTLIKSPDGSCSVGGEGPFPNGLCQINRDLFPFGSSLQFDGASCAGQLSWCGEQLGLSCSSPLIVFPYPSGSNPVGANTPFCSDYQAGTLPTQATTKVSYNFENIANRNQTASIIVNPVTNTISTCFNTVAVCAP